MNEAAEPGTVYKLPLLCTAAAAAVESFFPIPLDISLICESLHRVMRVGKANESVISLKISHKGSTTRFTTTL